MNEFFIILFSVSTGHAYILANVQIPSSLDKLVITNYNKTAVKHFSFEIRRHHHEKQHIPNNPPWYPWREIRELDVRHRVLYAGRSTGFGCSTDRTIVCSISYHCAGCTICNFHSHIVCAALLDYLDTAAVCLWRRRSHGAGSPSRSFPPGF